MPPTAVLLQPAHPPGRPWGSIGARRGPPSAWLREPAPLPLGYLLSLLSRKEPGQKLHFKTRFSPEVSTRCHLCLKLPSAWLPRGTAEAQTLPVPLEAQRKGEAACCPSPWAAGRASHPSASLEFCLLPPALAAPAGPGSRRAVPRRTGNSCPHVQQQP